MKYIDLRSDTVTLPSPAMRRAMADAVVGDDVLGEDPTVNRLQEEGARLTGKEASLFVPSGTAGNQIALLAHTGRGEEVILDQEAHIYYYEAGAPAMLAGVQPKPVAGLLSPRGPQVLEQALRPGDIHFPPTRVLCLENTFNRGGGAFFSPGWMEAMYNRARRAGLAVHLDGARLFNAAAACGCDAAELTRYCDSVMFCLSKGLGAPVGSLLCGDRKFIERARRYRKVLGGGMRQAGVLAAAGLVALQNIPRLAEDHRHARRLAEALSRVPGLEIDPAQVSTNIVVVRCTGGWTAPRFVDQLASHGIRCITFGPDTVRMVTHLDVTPQDVDYCLQVFAALTP